MMLLVVIFICLFNLYWIFMAFKYRNLRYMYMLKNRILNINCKFNQINKIDEEKKYPLIMDLIENLVENVNKLLDIKSIYSFKVSNKGEILKKNSTTYKMLEKEFDVLKQNDDTQIINILIEIIKFDYLVFKIKFPVKYFFEVYLKKILISRILYVIGKILNKIKYFAEKYDVQNQEVEKFKDFNINFNIIKRKKFF